MGFCLFKEAANRELFFAVNSSHVEEVLPQRDSPEGQPVCLLKFSISPKKFRPLVIGTRRDVQDFLMKSAKIGVRKIECQTFVGDKKLRAAPLLLNKTDRIIIVREMMPEEFMRSGIASATASEIMLEDGSLKIIAERPGVFAARANADRKVPILDPGG
jgi:hypothetical protein